jgi:hypothetical protein
MSRQSRPSPALVVAVIALVAALTGTAVAAKHLISGSSIKKHSIPGNRLTNHSITSTQVNKSKLGTVPHATVADTAANAAKLGGAAPAAFLSSSALTRWSFAMNKGAPSRAITIGPLTLTASCALDTGKTDAKLVATTSEANTFVTTSPDSLGGVPTTINPGTPYTVVEQDTSAPDDGNSNAFAAFDGQGKLAVFSTAQTLGVAINTPGADCRFFGYLVNDA